MDGEMARKELITKDKIGETAFALAKKEGIENVTARKLAAQIGCSTQPIFRVYANMSELYAEIYQKAISNFGDYYENYKSEVDTPFLHLGLAYINYARDESKLFQGTVVKEDRSLMNVPFVTGSDELDAKFVAEAKAAGFENLKGHRSVGGMRASIYNAMPKEGVEKLVAFMREFEQNNTMK